MNIRYPRQYRDSEEKLRSLPIVTPDGRHIALGQVTDIEVVAGPPMLKSENARLNGWVYVDIQGRDLGTYVAEARQRVAEQVELPSGYSISWSGQYEHMQRAKERLGLVAPLTLAVILLLLYLIFRNVTEVLILVATLPLALVGGAWLLYWLDYNLSVAVAVGFIALAGVAVETAVVMLVYLNQSYEKRRLRAETEGRSLTAGDLHKAVIEGALLRVRPKMMTVSTIIIGLLPIMLGTGTGSEVMRRIAAPMVGGMVSATLLTLVVIPAAFLLWKSSTLGQPGK